jgi:O-antigen ligase
VNSYLYFALSLGALGLLAIVIAFLVPIVRSWRMRRPRGERDRANEFAAFCFSCFISSMAMFAFTSFIQRAVILLMMFSVALIPRPRRLGGTSVIALRTDLVSDSTASSSVAQGGYADLPAGLQV